MARLLQRLGHFVNRRKGLVILTWVVIVGILVISSSLWAGKTTTVFSLKGQESTTALTLMDQKFKSNSNIGTARVTFETTGGATVLTPSTEQFIATKLESLRALPGVVSVSNPFDKAALTVSPDKQAAFATVVYGVDASLITAAQHTSFAKVLQENVTPSIIVGASGTATQAAQGATGKTGQMIGILVALFVLLLTFGSLSAAGMNLLTAIIGVGIGTLGISIVSGFTSLSSTTPVLAEMLGLAVGIDYALFIFARFRTELMRTRDVRSSVGIAVATAGSAVITAGLTVILALAGLSVVGIPFLTQMGLAAAGTVAVAVIGALTLVPAVLSLFGLKILSRSQRKYLSAHASSVEDFKVIEPNAFYRGWLRIVLKRPAIIVTTVIAILGIATIPFFSMHTSLVRSEKVGSIQGVAEATISKHFSPGVNGPIIIYVQGVDVASVANQDFAKAMIAKDVATVLPARYNSDSSAAIVTVIPLSAANSVQTQNLVTALRKVVISTPTTRSYITGSTAVSVDISKLLNGALPLYLGLVGGLALLLLIMVFRSIWVPLVGVFGFLLTIGSSIGATVAVFQWGHLSTLFGVKGTNPLMSITPILAIGILFGLAMDYQVFMVSRIHEAHSKGDDPVESIKHGFHNAAPIVLAAASIMFSVFSGFFPGADSTIAQIAFALAFGIFVDAIIVRMIFVPAALKLLGATAWALPRWLEWLPSLDIEGHGIEEAELLRLNLGSS